MGVTAERVASLAEDVPGRYLYLTLLSPGMAGALLVEASGSKGASRSSGTHTPFFSIGR
jgi:hypothetical protein